jgi:hypothetical protein
MKLHKGKEKCIMRLHKSKIPATLFALTLLLADIGPIVAGAQAKRPDSRSGRLVSRADEKKASPVSPF